LKKLSLAISPCPNDTYIFGALVNNWIDTDPYQFSVQYHDIKELNEIAEKGLADVVKISAAAWTKLGVQYSLLESGGAMGLGCGPLLVARQETDLETISKGKILIPGKSTTAAALLQFFSPEFTNLEETLFSEIMDKVAQGYADAGVIIHESRFTYPSFGLKCIADLGEFWENKTNMPVPLGVIVCKNPEDQETISELIRKSIEYAEDNIQKVMPYISEHAREMNSEVIKAHIQLYVNDFTINLGDKGHQALEVLKQYIR